MQQNKVNFRRKGKSIKFPDHYYKNPADQTNNDYRSMMIFLEKRNIRNKTRNEGELPRDGKKCSYNFISRFPPRKYYVKPEDIDELYDLLDRARKAKALFGIAEHVAADSVAPGAVMLDFDIQQIHYRAVINPTVFEEALKIIYAIIGKHFNIMIDNDKRKIDSKTITMICLVKPLIMEMSISSARPGISSRLKAGEKLYKDGIHLLIPSVLLSKTDKIYLVKRILADEKYQAWVSKLLSVGVDVDLDDKSASVSVFSLGSSTKKAPPYYAATVHQFIPDTSNSLFASDFSYLYDAYSIPLLPGKETKMDKVKRIKNQQKELKPIIDHIKQITGKNDISDVYIHKYQFINLSINLTRELSIFHPPSLLNTLITRYMGTPSNITLNDINYKRLIERKQRKLTVSLVNDFHFELASLCDIIPETKIVWKLLSAIKHKKISRNDWNNIMMSLHKIGGRAYFILMDRFCQGTKYYDHEGLKEKWANIIQWKREQGSIDKDMGINVLYGLLKYHDPKLYKKIQLESIATQVDIMVNNHKKVHMKQACDLYLGKLFKRIYRDNVRTSTSEDKTTWYIYNQVEKASDGNPNGGKWRWVTHTISNSCNQTHTIVHEMISEGLIKPIARYLDIHLQAREKYENELHKNKQMEAEDGAEVPPPKIKTSKTEIICTSAIKILGNTGSRSGVIRQVRISTNDDRISKIMDKEATTMGVENGILKIHNSGIVELLEGYQPQEYVSKHSPTRYVKFQPDNPRVKRVFMFLRTRFRDIEYDAFGMYLLILCCSLDGHAPPSIFPIQYGPGSTGKTAGVNLHMNVLGPDYACAPATELWTRPPPSAEKASPGFLMLMDSRFAACNELGPGEEFYGPTLKKTTGNDPITARNLYDKTSRSERIKAVQLCTTNVIASVKECGPSMERRLKVIPVMQQYFPKGSVMYKKFKSSGAKPADPQFSSGSKFMRSSKTREAYLSILVEAAKIYRYKYKSDISNYQSYSVRKHTADYFIEQNTLVMFLAEKLVAVKSDDSINIIDVMDIVGTYLIWYKARYPGQKMPNVPNVRAQLLEISEVKRLFIKQGNMVVLRAPMELLETHVKIDRDLHKPVIDMDARIRGRMNQIGEGFDEKRKETETPEETWIKFCNEVKEVNEGLKRCKKDDNSPYDISDPSKESKKLAEEYKHSVVTEMNTTIPSTSAILSSLPGIRGRQRNRKVNNKSKKKKDIDVDMILEIEGM